MHQTKTFTFVAMSSSRRYIAFFLWLVIIVPVIYQLVHMVLHHHPTEQTCTQHIEKRAEHTDKGVFANHASSLLTPVEYCFICDFEFALFVVSDFRAIETIEEAHYEPFKHFNNYFTLVSKFSSISLRAPPYQS